MKLRWVVILLAGVSCFSTHPKTLFAQGPPTVTLHEYPVRTQMSGLQGITAGPDGALWFTEYSSSRVGRITTAGSITEDWSATSPLIGPIDIAAGLDGALWVTASLNNQIGRVTTAGVIGSYSLTSGNPRPYGITAGPDGALWFTEYLGGQIGRITTAGVVTEYAVPASNSGPTGITAGPDGALWFTEGNANQIGRITTAGTVTEYPVLTPNSGLQQIAIGSDGALWFAEYLASQIGRITVAGVVTEYLLPASSMPNGITAGPDGALWFTEFGTNKVGRITTAGAISEYPVGSGPNWIAVGPDGALWFTENAANNIGQLVLGYNPAAKNQAQQAAPVKLGTSGSNINDTGAVCCTGTLGSVVKDTSGHNYILSNNHVLARVNQASPGEQIIQRGYGDTVPVCSSSGTIPVAQLSQFVPLNFTGGGNTVDAALAQTLTNTVDPAGTILGVGTISTAITAPAIGMHVEKAGRTTGLTTGNVDAVNVTLYVAYSACGSTVKQAAKFLKQFTILPETTFGRAGDSGSLVLRTVAKGKSPNPVGLLFAGNATGATVANPIGPVLTQLGALVGSTLSFVGSSATDSGAVAADRPDPQVEYASQVKDRNDDLLMSLPEVVGHGVGYSLTGSGNVVIRLFVRKATDVARRAAPIAIEGVPVEVQETGEFDAIPCRQN